MAGAPTRLLFAHQRPLLHSPPLRIRFPPLLHSSSSSSSSSFSLLGNRQQSISSSTSTTSPLPLIFKSNGLSNLSLSFSSSTTTGRFVAKQQTKSFASSSSSSGKQEQREEKQKKKSGGFIKNTLILLTTVVIGTSVYVFGIREAEGITETEFNFLRRIPLRGVSRVWGSIHQLELPVWLRKPLFMWWTNHYGCNLNEMQDPLESYATLNDFFTRKLKKGVRPLDSGDNILVSPVDGTVLVFGKVDVKQQKLEQIKGVNYSLASFLGAEEAKRALSLPPGKDLYYCVIYLSPGDYHGIHSPTDWNMNSYRHFPGYLFPVAPWLVKLLSGLFALNERVVISGQWKQGYFSLSPIGATNVGSIKLTFPDAPNVQTNQKSHPPEGGVSFGGSLTAANGSPIGIKKGEELAFFHFGSTVVLLFEAPSASSEEKALQTFPLTPGQTVKLGQTIFRNP